MSYRRGFGWALVFFAFGAAACRAPQRNEPLNALSKDHRVLAEERLGFRLHDREETHGFLRVGLRVRWVREELLERYTVRLRVRNEGPANVTVDLAAVRFELGGDASIRWHVEKLDLGDESALRVPVGEALTTRLFFDLRGPSRWPLDTPVAVHVPYRVGEERFEIRVPFVKTEPSDVAGTIFRWATLPVALAVVGTLELCTVGIEVEDGQTDSATLRMIGRAFRELFATRTRPLEVATRTRLAPLAAER
ncbi:MAG: hypothetical protein JNM84_25485 [Planctomycetes bacterium]|nr:hypothetical protein [Planctomycetota bacterium]